MKKIFVVAFIMFANSSNAKSFYGIKAGYSLSNVSTSNVVSFNSKSNLIVGLSYDYVMKSRIGIGAELLFDKRGFEPKVNYTDNKGNPIASTYVYRYNYISVPVKVGYRTRGKFYGIANIGIVPAFNIKAESSIKLQGAQPLITDVKSTTSSIDISGLGEIGFGFKVVNKLNVGISARHQRSITEIDKSATLSMKHYSTSILVGASINL